MGLLLTPPTLPLIVPTTGLPKAQVRSMVRSGDFLQVRPGALTPALPDAPRWQKPVQRALAQVVAVHRKLQNGAVISHASAALVHGLWVYRAPAQVHVTQWAKPNSQGARDIRRHSGVLTHSDVTTVNGIRATTIKRTILDCARTMHPRDALVIADSGLRKLAQPDKRDRPASDARIRAVREELLAMVGRGPGRRRVRTILEHADAYSESAMESVLRWVIVSRGLPAPTTQMEIRTSAGVFYADLGWRWQRPLRDGGVERWTLVVEYDGDVKYLPGGGLVGSAEEAAAALVAEKRREDAIREEPGTRFVRLARDDLRELDDLCRKLLGLMPPGSAEDSHPVPELLVAPRTR